MSPEQEAANRLAETVLENIDDVQEAFEHFERQYHHSATEGLRAILAAGRDYERRKYMS